MVIGAAMRGPSSDAGYSQHLPPAAAMPRGPSPAAGFSQPPANQAMMPGIPQPSSSDPSSNSFPVAAPRSQPDVAAYSQPQQPAG